MIIIIGDQPSKKNINPAIPFVGTKSYATLLQWIAKLDIDITEVVMGNREHVKQYSWAVKGSGQDIVVNHPQFACDVFEQDKVIALGSKASKHLKSLGLKHFTLPHPSGRNLKLNDKKYVDKVLKECKDYLNRR